MTWDGVVLNVLGFGLSAGGVIYTGCFAWRIYCTGRSVTAAEHYRHMKWLALGMTALAVVSLVVFYAGYALQDTEDTRFNALAIWLMIFWTLGPPVWFMLEYCAAVPRSDGNPYLTGVEPKQVKDYADLASKVWAAFLALFAVGMAHQIDARKEAVKRLKEGRVEVAKSSELLRESKRLRRAVDDLMVEMKRLREEKGTGK